MPTMNGIELSKKIREKYSIPIILYTGQGSEEVAEAAFTVGVDDYLRKEMDPSHYQVLAKRIRHVVEKKRTETLYQRVVEGIRDGLCIVSGDRIVYANQVQTDLFGAKKISDVIGTKAIDFVHPDDREFAAQRMMERAGGDLDPPFFKYKVQRLDGGVLEVEVLTNVIEYNGKPAFMVLTRDVTERSRLEAEKRRSDERFKYIIELAPDGIVTVSMRGIVTSANPAFLRITGYSKEEIIGKRFYQIGTLRKIDLRNNLKIFAQIARGKLPPPVEFVFQYKDGTQGWGEAHLGFIDREGTRELIAIVRDITERKWVEKELFENSEELKRIAHEKYKTIVPAESIPWSNHMNSAIGVNLQDSLFSIKNSLLALRKDPSKLAELIDLMDISADSANIQLKELFEDDESLKTKPYIVSEIIEQSIQEVKIPPEIIINTSFKGQNSFNVDPVKIKNAVKEVLDSSVISMPKGGKINLSCDVEKDSLVIEIKDTSLGLSEKEVRILQNNGILEKDSHRYSIEESQKAIEDHHGTILVNSEIGKGTTYTIILPMNYRNELETHDYQVDTQRVNPIK